LEQRNIERIKQTIQQKTALVDSLQEEKNVLMEEFQRLKHAVEKLSEENSTLREYFEDMQESLQQEGHRAIALSQKKETKPEAPSCLPEEESCLQYFWCCNTNMKCGRLYVTENYLVFETILKHLQGEHQIVIPIRDIICIDKTKVISKWVPGKGLSLSIQMKDNTFYKFPSIIKRDEAVRLIVQQGKKISIITETENISINENDQPEQTSKLQDNEETDDYI